MRVISPDSLGQAIHAAKRVGGPWGPPCGRPKPGSTNPYQLQDWITIEYNDNSEGDYACECQSMAVHLIQLLRDQGKIGYVSEDMGTGWSHTKGENLKLDR